MSTKFIKNMQANQKIYKKNSTFSSKCELEIDQDGPNHILF